MIRTYLVPKIGTGTHEDPYRAGYCDGIPYTGRDYGDEPVFLVTVDVDDVTHATLLARPDVVPVDPDGTADPTRLEALKIPGDPRGLSSLAHLQSVFSVMQQFQGQGQNPLAGISLDDLVPPGRGAKQGETARTLLYRRRQGPK